MSVLCSAKTWRHLMNDRRHADEGVGTIGQPWDNLGTIEIVVVLGENADSYSIVLLSFKK